MVELKVEDSDDWLKDRGTMPVKINDQTIKYPASRIKYTASALTMKCLKWGFMAGNKLDFTFVIRVFKNFLTSSNRYNLLFEKLVYLFNYLLAFC